MTNLSRPSEVQDPLWAVSTVLGCNITNRPCRLLKFVSCSARPRLETICSGLRSRACLQSEQLCCRCCSPTCTRFVTWQYECALSQCKVSDLLPPCSPRAQVFSAVLRARSLQQPSAMYSSRHGQPTHCSDLGIELLFGPPSPSFSRLVHQHAAQHVIIDINSS